MCTQPVLTKAKLLKILTIVLLLWASLPVLDSGSACRAQGPAPNQLTPENTVILANETDASFCRDFSVLLKRTRLEWFVLDSADVPELAKDKNLIIIGRPDAGYTGEIISAIISPEEAATIGAEGSYATLEKVSPWEDGRTIYICAGADRLLTKKAAEQALTSIIASEGAPGRWIQTSFSGVPLENARDYVAQLQYEWDDAELPLEDMAIDVDAKPPKRISALEAAEDVERLFYLFSHGYAAYGFFNDERNFDEAKTRILQELMARSEWAVPDFSRMLYEHLDFIHDCHTSIGDHPYGDHADFWYDMSLELEKTGGEYHFISDDTHYTVISINGEDPQAWIWPSLNEQGEPVYRVGLLSPSTPEPLVLAAQDERGARQGARQFEIELHRSDFAYYSNDIFREDRIGGIPVVRIRSFSDHHADALNQFLETAAKYKGEPYIIVDIRGNGGGNESWPITWIRQFSGGQAGSVFIFTELNSRTTMIGRANAMAYWYDMYPQTDMYRVEASQYTKLAEAFEGPSRKPYWSGPYYPRLSSVLGDTTIIVVMNDLVGSAGEGFVMRVSQVVNVVLVGENSRGCLSFGNVSAHQLPHSKLMVWLPINFGLFLDMEFREETGLFPDLWVPAADAVNYAVAAVRKGTITTQQSLPREWFEQEFVPENPWQRVTQEERRDFLVVALLSAGGVVWAYVIRNKPRIVAIVGGGWLVVGGVWILFGRVVGLGLVLAGAVGLVWGGYRLWKARAIPSEGELA